MANGLTVEGALVALQDLVQRDHDILLDLHGKVDQLIANQAAQAKLADDHEKRLRELEQWKWRLAGVVAVCGIVVPALVALAVKRFGG